MPMPAITAEPDNYMVIREMLTMVLSLAAYIYASIKTENHEFNTGFAFLLFLADSFTAAAFGPPLFKHHARRHVEQLADWIRRHIN